VGRKKDWEVERGSHCSTDLRKSESEKSAGHGPYSGIGHCSQGMAWPKPTPQGERAESYLPTMLPVAGSPNRRSKWHTSMMTTKTKSIFSVLNLLVLQS
jgi:hypothetical protein